jgi:phenylalanyl-tRNA synthetase alpha chain
MHPRTLDAAALRRALAIPDLTDPNDGPHALQLLVDRATAALAAAWGAEPRLRRAPPLASVADNYDRLRYSPEGVVRDARYTRYVARDVVLRTQTTAVVPAALAELAREEGWRDVLLACPGIVYRRDCIDRLHAGEPHQLDLWRLRRGGAELSADDLEAMVGAAMGALLPGRAWRTTPAVHPYTEAGRQIDVRDGDAWIEVGECGLASRYVLGAEGLGPETSGLAMGLGLDRVLMLRKGVPDIRLLRSADPRVAVQMRDLEPYRPVSSMPALRRDLSIAVAAGDDVETLGDRAREALGDAAARVEAVEVISETPYEALPPAARGRLGLGPRQKNVLVRVVLRDLERTLTHDEANALRDRVYAALHRGSVHAWASRRAG